LEKRGELSPIPFEWESGVKKFCAMAERKQAVNLRNIRVARDVPNKKGRGFP
jgi:hypothetical protein